MHVKFIFIFILSLNIYGQTADQLREMLDPNFFKQYEKMFEKMIEDMEKLDRSQFEEYNGLFEKNLLDQFKIFEDRNNSYQWIENKDHRILKFSGKMIENDQVKIEIKDGVINISAAFVKVPKNPKGIQGKRRSIRYLSIKISVPKGSDESSVVFDNSGENFKMTFKKFKSSKKKTPPRPLRSPLKKQEGAPTI